MDGVACLQGKWGTEEVPWQTVPSKMGTALISIWECGLSYCPVFLKIPETQIFVRIFLIFKYWLLIEF